MRRLAAALLALALPFALTTSAHAGAVYPGAGFKVTDIRTATATFTVPPVDCAGVGETGLVQFGLFATDITWRAGVNVACLSSQPQFSIDIATGNGAAGRGGDQIARPGHAVKVTLVSTGSRTTFRVTDLTIGETVALTQPRVSPVLAVGAYSERPVPKFASPTLGFTANSGMKLSALDYARHTQVKNGVTQIGCGQLWGDGTHFRLYYKHH